MFLSRRKTLAAFFACFVFRAFFAYFHGIPLRTGTGTNSSKAVGERSYPNSCPSHSVIAQLNLERKARISRACQQHWPKSLPWNRDFWGHILYVLEEYKALYVEIPKAGSTNIKSYVAKLHDGGTKYNYSVDLMEIHHRFDRKPNNRSNSAMYSFRFIDSSDEAKFKFDNYFKFVVYRDPLERIVSSWRFFYDDAPVKAYLHSHYDLFFSHEVEMIKAVRKGATLPTAKQIINGQAQRLTLKEFFQYLLLQNDSDMLNKHWRPQTSFSRPCQIEYDFVGTTNNLSCELDFVLSKLSGKKLPFTLPSSGKMFNATRELRGVPKDLVRNVLEKHYAADYKLLPFFDVPDL